MFAWIKKNYHWVIAAVGLLQLLIYGGAVNNYSAYHMIPVSESLEISRTAFSLTNSVRAVLGVLSTMYSGTLIKKWGYRKTAALGLALAGGAYVVYSCMQNYWMLLAGSSLIGLASGICATSGVSRLLNNWFHKYRGTVLGLVTSATALGSTLLGFVQAAAIEYVSWRLSFIIVAGLQLGLAMLIYLFVRNVPADMGLKPYGEGQVDPKKNQKTDERWAGFSMETLKKRPAYYLLIGCAFLSCLCVLATQYNLVPYFKDCGMSETRASGIYGTMMLFLSVMKLGMGALCDAIGAKRVTLICHSGCALGLVLVLLLPQTNAAMIGALLVYDLALPLSTMMFPLISVELFGYRAQSQYIGMIMAMSSACTIVSGPLSNLLRDIMGSYRPVFWGCAILSVCMIGLYGILYGMVAKDRKKLETEEKL